MLSRVEHEFLFSYTVADDGQVVPLVVAPLESGSRAKLEKSVHEKMRRDGCAGGVEVLFFEVEMSKYHAVVSCDAERGVSEQVGQAFFRAMMEKVFGNGIEARA